MFKKTVKKILDFILEKFGKRITNIESSPKQFSVGLQTVLKYSGQPSTVIDIGVAEGTPELYEALPFGSYKYFLVEPDSRYHSSLHKLEESYSKNVTLLKAACGSHSGEVVFYEASEGRHSSLYSKSENASQVEVPIHTLDQIFSHFRIRGPVLVKIDVEGAEIEVLKGATQALKEVSVVIVESWMNGKNQSEQSFEELVTFMSKNDFRVFDFLSGHCNEEGVLKLIDVVFVKNS